MIPDLPVHPVLQVRPIREAKFNCPPPPGNSISTLQKPDKIYLENTNLQLALSPSSVNPGTLRETSMLNRLLSAGHTIGVSPEGDFRIDEEIDVEVVGKDLRLPGNLETVKNLMSCPMILKQVS